MPLSYLSLSGCLLDPAIDTAPPTTDSPPVIDRSGLHPADNGITTLDGNCNSVLFKADRISDTDVKDFLYVRWMLDWDNTANRTADDPYWRQNTETIFPTSSGSVERNGPCMALALATLKTGTHTLKLFVADRQLLNTGNGTEFPTDLEGLWDSFQWTFVVGDSGYGDPCDQQTCPH